MDGDFATDLYALLELFARSAVGASADRAGARALGYIGSAIASFYSSLEAAAHRRCTNTKSNSVANISYHYDAGNDFYRLFLDRTMLYSSGIHADKDVEKMERMNDAAREAELETAQLAKIDAMIHRARIGASDRVLEIGCGWGTAAIRMAKTTGASVVGITVSREQLKEVCADGMGSLTTHDVRHVPRRWPSSLRA